MTGYSYLANQYLEDDLGRSAVRHKPLNKGDGYPGLAKVFLEDPSMRPKVFVPADREPRKDFSSLNTADIEGGKGKIEYIIAQPRGTDPLNPRYKLASRPSSAFPASQTQGDSSPVTHPIRTRPPSASPCMQRSTISTDDIEGAQSKPRISRQAVNDSLDVRDIEGASPSPIHSQPHFRRHVGVNPRDTNFNSSDINEYMVRRQRDLYKNDPGHKEKREAAESLLAMQQKSQREAELANVRSQRSGLPSDEYTGLPAFQNPPDVEASIQARKKEMHTPSASTMVAERLAKEQRVELNIQEKDLDSARTCQKFTGDLAPAYRARTVQSAGRVHARQAATATAAALSINRSQVEKLWDSLRRLDREGSGKCTILELSQALDQAQVQRSTQQMEALVRGLRDNVGLLAYRSFAKSLLSKSMNAAPSPQYKTDGQSLFAPSPASSPLSIKGQKVQPSQQLSSRPSTSISQSLKPNPSPLSGEARPERPEPQQEPSTPVKPSSSHSPHAPVHEAATMMTASSYDSYDFRPQSSLGTQQVLLGNPSQDDDADGFIVEDHSPENWYPSDQGTSSPSHPTRQGGRLWGTKEEQRAGAEEWKAKTDATHKVTQYHVKASKETSGTKEQQQSSTFSDVGENPKDLRVFTLSTTTRDIKTGRLAAEDLEASLDSKAASHSGWRPLSAKVASSKQPTPQSTPPKPIPELQATQPSGQASIGSTLKGPAAILYGSSGFIKPAQGQSVKAQSWRPMSARAAMAAEVASVRALPAF